MKINSNLDNLLAKNHLDNDFTEPTHRETLDKSIAISREVPFESKATVFHGETQEFSNDAGEKMTNPVKRNSEYSEEMIVARSKHALQARRVIESDVVAVHDKQQDIDASRDEILETDQNPLDRSPEEIIFNADEFNHQVLEEGSRNSPENMSINMLKMMMTAQEKGDSRDEIVASVVDRYQKSEGKPMEESLRHYLGEIGILSFSEAEETAFAEMIGVYYDRSFAESEPLVRSEEDEKRIHTHPEDLPPFIIHTYLKVINNGGQTPGRRDHLEKFYMTLYKYDQKIGGLTFANFVNKQSQKPTSYQQRTRLLKEFLEKGK